MTKDQIEFLKSLDTTAVDGTIQSVLIQENLTKVSFENVSRFLLMNLVREKQFLIQDNIRLSGLVNNGVTD